MLCFTAVCTLYPTNGQTVYNDIYFVYVTSYTILKEPHFKNYLPLEPLPKPDHFFKKKIRFGK